MTAAPSYRPCWADIDLTAFRRNLQTLQSTLPPTTGVMAVVKANAYGHGSVSIARAAQDGGAAYLGVSSLEEGVELRQAGIRTPILVLGSLFPFENFPVLFEHQLTPTVASLAMAEALSKEAVIRGRKCPIHLEIDTGLGRTGVSTISALDVITQISQLPNLILEGVYTHFSSADVDTEFTRRQSEAFIQVVQAAAAAGIKPRWVHAANSSAVLRSPNLPMTLARPGLALYGVPPFSPLPENMKLEPVLSFKTRIVFVKMLPQGSSVSYARTWTASRLSRIATLAVGYADGLPRLLSNRGEVLVRGQRAPIVGRVTMDMTMIDVTDLPECHVGDDVVLLGRQDKQELRAVEWAAWADTNAYEILCGISARVPRVEHG